MNMLHTQSNSGSGDSANDPTVRIFWLALSAHVLIWTLICTLTQPNLPLDMVEMIYWGQQWQLGYHKHPPLPAWIAATVWELGNHTPWLMYLTSQMTIAVTFWAVWQLAREGLGPWLALCAVGVLQGCYYFTFTINDINNTIVTRPMWALSMLFLYRAIASKGSRRQTLNWCLTGVAIGLGMLCKYYLGVLVLAMMMVPVLMPTTRKSLRTSGPWLMVGVSLLIFSPHLWWMVNNDFITIQYVLNRSGNSTESSWVNHLVSPAKFLLTQVGAWLPITLLAWPLVGKAMKALRAQADVDSKLADGNSLFRSYLSIVVLGPVLIYLCVATLTGANIRSMWGGPLFCCLGVLLLSLNRDFSLADFAPTAGEDVRKVLRGCVIASVVMMIALIGRNVVSPTFRGDFSRVHFPGETVSSEVHRRWAELSDKPLSIVGGDMFVAGCVGVYSESKVDVFAGMSLAANPWLDDESINQRGAVFVWNIDETGEVPPNDWISRFDNARIAEPFHCNASGAASSLKVRLGMIVVPPPVAQQATAPPPAEQQATAPASKLIR
jgi:hypothetical protein